MPTAVATENVQSHKSLLLRQSIILFGLSMIAVLWIGLGWKLQAERQAADQRLVGDATNLARAFEESVLRTLQQVDLRLQFMRNQVLEAPDPAGWHKFIADIPLDQETSFQVALTDARGLLITSSLDPKPATPVDLSDRDHIRTHLRGTGDDLFISRPLLGRVSKQWSINVSRPIRGPDGKTIAVAVASLSAASFTRFYEQIELGSRSAVLLFGADGHVRAATGGLDTSVQSIQDTPFFRAVAGTIDGRFAGPMLGSSNAVAAWRKVRNAPLYVTVAVDKPSVRIGQSNAEKIEMAAAIIVTMMICLATTLIVRGQQRIHIARLEIQATARQVEAKSQELEAMLDSISQGIVMVDRQGGVLVTNRRALELLDQPTPEALSAAIGPLLLDLQRQAGRGERGDGGPVRTDLTVADRVLEVARSAMPDGNFVLTFTDVTPVKRRQQELEAARNAADVANHAKSQFLSTMSHEMRTPLNGMIGALDLLAKTKLDSEQLQLVETALQSGEALLVHINDVLDFSKMEAGKLVLEPAPFNLRHLVDSVLKIVTPQAEARSNTLHRDLGEEVPRWIVGDAVRIRQILLNLVGNAVKFTRNGQVTVRIRNVGGTYDRPDIQVAIEDTGYGIPQDRLGNLFQEFSMIDASYSRKQGGTGLGLAICKRLVEAMSGEIGVDSKVGEGSRFWFRVPFDRAAEPAIDDKSAASLPDISDIVLDILLVDDNLTNQMVASRMLAAAGHLVTTASDGLEALNAATKKRYDVILMDISMPEMDGIEATKRIRQLPEPFASVPIIALTANAIAGDRERFLAAGMDDYLTKPIRRATIEARLAKFAGDMVRRREQMERAASAPEPTKPVPQPASDGAVIDPGELERLAAETSPDVVPLVVEQFITEQVVRLEEVARAREAGDADALRKAAHALAGASASVGAVRLRGRAKEIELDCAEGRRAAAMEKADSLPALALATVAALEKQLDKNRAVSAAA